MVEYDHWTTARAATNVPDQGLVLQPGGVDVDRETITGGCVQIEMNMVQFRSCTE